MTDSQEKVWLAVIERDHGMCRLCGRSASSVHHVIPRSNPFSELWRPWNMVCLCNACHDKAHNYPTRVKLFALLASKFRKYRKHYSAAPFSEYYQGDTDEDLLRVQERTSRRPIQ